MKNNFFALIALTVLLKCNCQLQTSDQCIRIFHFEIPMSIIVSNDTISIGDTLWLESEIPNILLDLNSNELIDIDSFDLKIRTGINRMELANTPTAELDFDYKNLMGRFEVLILSSLTKAKLHYDVGTLSQKLKTGLIPKKAGLYHIAFYNLTKETDDINLIDSNCWQKIEITYKMNDRIDNNYYLLEKSPGQIATKEVYDKVGGFTFFVIE